MARRATVDITPLAILALCGGAFFLPWYLGIPCGILAIGLAFGTLRL